MLGKINGNIGSDLFVNIEKFDRVEGEGDVWNENEKEEFCFPRENIRPGMKLTIDESVTANDD